MASVNCSTCPVSDSCPVAVHQVQDNKCPLVEAIRQTRAFFKAKEELEELGNENP